MSRFDEDDWMNPPRSFRLETPPPKDGTYYVIERKKRTPVTGNVAFLESWDTWKEYRNKKKRDDELKRLREATTWQVRGRIRRYIHGSRIGSDDPFEFEDV